MTSNTDDEPSELANLQNNANIPLDELLKLYSNNAQIINNDVSQEDDNEDSYTSSEIEEEEDDDDRRHHLLHMNGELLPDDDTEDSIYEPDIIRFIHIGDEYQAHIDSKPAYNSCNGREIPADELLWSSSNINDVDNEHIDKYLQTIHTEYSSSDDEISLQTLLNCQLNTELALDQFRQLPNKTIYSYSKWSLEEIQEFEEGLREYGKKFFEISVFKCLNRSVRELIHFYYEWKKSERYQLFIDNYLSFVSNDFKLHSNCSISFVTKKRSFDYVENDNESSSSKRIPSVETTSTIV